MSASDSYHAEGDQIWAMRADLAHARWRRQTIRRAIMVALVGLLVGLLLGCAGLASEDEHLLRVTWATHVGAAADESLDPRHREHSAATADALARIASATSTRLP